MFIKIEERVPPTREKLPEGYMKLSWAIREGAKLRPAVKDTMEYFDQCGSCALGAAYHFLTGKTPIDGGEEICDYLEKRFGIGDASLLTDICLRFHRKVPREEIADWVAGQGY